MEWPVVFVPWCSEGLFPSAKASEDGRLDEERRLFYVAVTRAKDLLYLFTPSVRRMADGGIMPVEPSTFVKEIPPELVNSRRAYSGYDGGFGGGGFRGGYGGGGFRGGYGSRKPSPPALKKTWRR